MGAGSSNPDPVRGLFNLTKLFENRDIEKKTGLHLSSAKVKDEIRSSGNDL
jgi:hypothetical protein